MKIDWAVIRIFIRPGITDMRKQINSLSVLVQDDVADAMGYFFFF